MWNSISNARFQRYQHLAAAAPAAATMTKPLPAAAAPVVATKQAPPRPQEVMKKATVAAAAATTSVVAAPAPAKKTLPQNQKGSIRKPRSKIPTVSHDVGIALNQYGGDVAALEQQMLALRQARKLVASGFVSADQLHVLAAPGSLSKAAPTVSSKNDAVDASVAEISAAPTLVGQTPLNPDPLKALAAKSVAAATSEAAVSSGAMVMPAGNAGGANAVPSSQTPALVSQAAVVEAERPTVPSQPQPIRSLFRSIRR